MKILIVDDLPDIRLIVRKILNANFQCSITEAESGIAASIELGNEIFDLVISDFEMANGTGLWLYHFMIESYPQIPLIILTASPKNFHAQPDATLRAIIGKDQISNLLSSIKKIDVLSF